MAQPAEGYPGRLYHAVPSWVETSALYHIRLRAQGLAELTAPEIGKTLLDAAEYYHKHRRWHCRLFLIMPDHVHALMSFPSCSRMSDIVGKWKAYTKRRAGVSWKQNFFDHRIRVRAEADKTFAYIIENPCRKRLCTNAESWPWRWMPHEPL